jgi:hypothetical protein
LLKLEDRRNKKPKKFLPTELLNFQHARDKKSNCIFLQSNVNHGSSFKYSRIIWTASFTVTKIIRELSNYLHLESQKLHFLSAVDAGSTRLPAKPVKSSRGNDRNYVEQNCSNKI